MKRTPLRRKTALRADPAKTRDWQRRTAAKLGAGKRTKAWAAKRLTLKEQFKRAGITTCELRLAGCWRDNGLGFAHSEKRRNITTDAQLGEVILACNSCHDKIEGKSHAEMGEAVRAVIAGRSAVVR